MVAPTDFNLQNLHGRTFEGFVQFQVPNGSTWYRMKERQTMSFQIRYNRAEHYSDDGQKAVDPTGHSHSFSMTIKLTSDLFDSVFSASSDPQTLSYWIYKNEIYEPIQVIFVTSMPTLSGPVGSTSENDVNLKFVLDPSGFSTGLGASGGSPEITVTGTVLSITSALRSTTTDQ